MIAFWEHGILQPQALFTFIYEKGTGILIKFNHNSHNDKNISQAQHPPKGEKWKEDGAKDGKRASVES